MLMSLPLIMLQEPVRAQEAAYKWNVGLNMGIGGYLGDYNPGNVLSNVGFAGKVGANYIYDSRWEFSANLGYQSVKGDIKGNEDKFPTNFPVSFNATAVDLSFRVEFNFFPFGIGETYKALKIWTPYIAAGVGLAGAKPQHHAFVMAPELPVAVGVKYKVTPRMNLKLEFSVAKTFSSSIDAMTSPYGIDRTWLRHTDWLTSLQVGVSYEFGERCATCHYVE